MMFRRSSLDQTEQFRHRLRNLLQTLILLVFLGGYLMLLGQLIWGSAVSVWLLVVAVLLLPVGSPQLLLKLSRARPLSRSEAPELYRLTEQLAARAELERLPALYYLPLQQPNALALGSRSEPIIGVSDGLLRLLNRRELAGVLAHEISHLRHGDLQVMQLAELISRLIDALSWVGLLLLFFNLPLALFAGYPIDWSLLALLVFAPYLSLLARLGLSRVREYQADLGAAQLTDDPAGLATALQKIERQGRGMLHYLLPGRLVPNWLSSHPPTRERVRRLLELAGGATQVWTPELFAPGPRPQSVWPGQIPRPVPVEIFTGRIRRQPPGWW